MVTFMQVGDRLKTPEVPVWVVCSESHYSVLFSLELSVASWTRVLRVREVEGQEVGEAGESYYSGGFSSAVKVRQAQAKSTIGGERLDKQDKLDRHQGEALDGVGMHYCDGIFDLHYYDGLDKQDEVRA